MPPGLEVPTASDEDLALRAQQGCADSLEQLIRRYQVPLVRFLRRLGSPQEAEDLAQDTFVRACENLHRYRPSWRLSTWLFTIARRLWLNRQRRRTPTADTDAVASAASSSASPADVVAERESRQALWERAGEVLSNDQVTALWLYYVEELAVKDIARVLGRTRVGVKTMMFRARKRLVPMLDRPEGPPKNASAGCANPTRRCCGAAEVPNG
jgi:RNA polymerase sigma-70 factor (ECF subfamily)